MLGNVLKILNIISSPKGGGAELLVCELHKLLLEKGVGSHVLYFAGNREGLGENEKVLGMTPRNPIIIFYIRKILKKYIASTNSTLIVHVHLTWPFYYVSIASIGLSRVRLVYTEHSTHNKRRNIPLLWLFERFLYSRYSKIICISPGVYNSLAPWVGAKLEKRLITIPNGARLFQPVKRPAIEGRKLKLVSIGSLTDRKNFSVTIKAVAQLRNGIEKYTIVGEGPYRNQLEQLIRSHHLEDLVHLVGWCDDIEQYLYDADIQLIPSLWEGFGLVAIEGMSTGLSVVASDVEGLRDVLNPENHAVKLIEHPRFVEAWVEGIGKAKHKIESFGQEGIANSAKKQAEKYSLNTMLMQYRHIYNELNNSI